MKLIPLTKGLFCKVDDCDYERLITFKWYAQIGHSAFYASNGNRTKTPMHRLIMGLAKDSPQMVDHIDGDGLNNQRSNLRIATKAENTRNCRLSKAGSSGFKGVHWNSNSKAWLVHLPVDGKLTHFGQFNCPKKAAARYDEVATGLYGKFAKTNKMLGLI